MFFIYVGILIEDKPKAESLLSELVNCFRKFRKEDGSLQQNSKPETLPGGIAPKIRDKFLMPKVGEEKEDEK